jgi:hypothetical protein
VRPEAVMAKMVLQGIQQRIWRQPRFLHCQSGLSRSPQQQRRREGRRNSSGRAFSRRAHAAAPAVQARSGAFLGVL